jgi:hypothetical protein
MQEEKAKEKLISGLKNLDQKAQKLLLIILIHWIAIANTDKFVIAMK